MRELVRAIDDHAENVDLKVTSNLNAADDVQGQPPPTRDALGQQAGDTIQLPPIEPSV